MARQIKDDAAAKFIGPDPIASVRGALADRSGGTMGLLMHRAAQDKTGEATASLRRAVADYVHQQLTTSTQGADGQYFLRGAAGFQKFLNDNRRGLSMVFPGAQMKTLDAIAASLQRSNQSLLTKLPASPGTAQDITGVARHAAESGGAPSGHGGGDLLSLLVAMGVEHHTGSLLAAVGGAAAIKTIAVVRNLAGSMRNAGLRTIDDLVTEAMLNPQLAKTLLVKATPANRAAILPRLVAQLKTLAVVSNEPDEPRPLPRGQ